MEQTNCKKQKMTKVASDSIISLGSTALNGDYLNRNVYFGMVTEFQ